MQFSPIKLLLFLLVLTAFLPSGYGFKFSSEKAQKKFFKLALQRQLRNAEDESEGGAEEAVTDGPEGSSDLFKPKKKNVTKIDWKEVERLWNAHESDEEVAKKWRNINTNMKSGVRSILSSIFPKVVSMSSEAKVSGNCSAGILKWIISLRHLKDWSVKMLDAMGKPNAGVLEGAVTMFGNYHQCTKVRAPEDDEEDLEEENEDGEPINREFKEFFRGKFCVLEFKPWLPIKPRFYGFDTRLPALKELEEEDTVLKDLAQLAVFLNFVALRIDICVPSLCSRDDLQKVVNFLSKLIDFRGRVLRCEVERDSLIPEDVNVPQASAAILFAIVLAAFGTLTIASAFFGRIFKGPSPVKNFLESLTWKHAYSELTNTECYRKGYKVAPLYGLRYIIMMWIIMVHTMVIINFQFFRELMSLKELALSWGAQVLTKSAPQFDSLILLTAFCMAYYNESNGALKAFRTVVRKYLRITPIVMVAVGIMVLLPLARTIFHGGPTWGDFIPKPSEICQNYGLTNLLYIQNFQEPSQMCLPQTWLFCVEMQLALLFIPVFFVLSRSKFCSYIILLVIMIIGFGVNVYNVYANQLPPMLLWTIPDPEQRNFYYHVHFFKPWTHLSVFAVGVAAGHLCHDRKSRTDAGICSTKDKSGWKSILHVLGVLVSIFVMLSILYQHQEWIYGNFPEPLTAGIFDGLHRIIWAIAMSYIIYYITVNVESDEDSILAKILCSHTVIVMGRLTIVAYVIHPIVQMVFLGTQQTQLYSSPMLMVYGILGNTLLVYGVSFVLSILFELPCSSILTARKLNQELLRKSVESELYANKSTKPPMGFRNGLGEMELTKDQIHRF